VSHANQTMAPSQQLSGPPLAPVCSSQDFEHTNLYGNDSNATGAAVATQTDDTRRPVVRATAESVSLDLHPIRDKPDEPGKVEDQPNAPRRADDTSSARDDTHAHTSRAPVARTFAPRLVIRSSPEPAPSAQRVTPGMDLAPALRPQATIDEVNP